MSSTRDYPLGAESPSPAFSLATSAKTSSYAMTLKAFKNNLRIMTISCLVYLGIIALVVGFIALVGLLTGSDEFSLSQLSGSLLINSYPPFLWIMGIVMAMMLDFMVSQGLTRAQFSLSLFMAGLIVCLVLGLVSTLVNLLTGWSGVIANLAGFTNALFEFQLGWIIGLAFMTKRGRIVFGAILGGILAGILAGLPVAIMGQQVGIFNDPLYILIITGSLCILFLVLTQVLTRRTAIRC